MPAQGPRLGESAPRRVAVDIDGEQHVLGEPSPTHQLLIFTSPHCPWCEQLAPHVAPFASSLGPEFILLLVLADELPAGEARSYARRFGGPTPLKLVVASELFESYGIPGKIGR